VRAGLPIHDAVALGKADLDPRRDSLLVRRGKGGRRRDVGMEARRRLAVRRGGRARPARAADEDRPVVVVAVLAIPVLAALALRWAAVRRRRASPAGSARRSRCSRDDGQR
jgi:hypothetical protein